MSDQFKENDQFEVYDEEDKTLKFTVTDEEDGKGSVVNITGFTITFTLYKNKQSDTQVFQKTTAGDVNITDGPNGIFTVTVAGGDWTTGSIGVGHRWYEAEGTDTSNKDQMLAVGWIRVLENKG